MRRLPLEEPAGEPEGEPPLATGRAPGLRHRRATRCRRQPVPPLRAVREHPPPDLPVGLAADHAGEGHPADATAPVHAEQEGADPDPAQREHPPALRGPLPGPADVGDHPPDGGRRRCHLDRCGERLRFHLSGHGDPPPRLGISEPLGSLSCRGRCRSAGPLDLPGQRALERRQPRLRGTLVAAGAAGQQQTRAAPPGRVRRPPAGGARSTRRGRGTSSARRYSSDAADASRRTGRGRTSPGRSPAPAGRPRRRRGPATATRTRSTSEPCDPSSAAASPPSMRRVRSCGDRLRQEVVGVAEVVQQHLVGGARGPRRAAQRELGQPVGLHLLGHPRQQLAPAGLAAR